MGLKSNFFLKAGALTLAAFVLTGCGKTNSEKIISQSDDPEIVVDSCPVVKSEADRAIFETDENGYVIGQKPALGKSPIDTIVEEECTEMMTHLYYSDNYQDCMKASAANLDYVKSDVEKDVILLNDRYFDDLFRPENYSVDELCEIIDENDGIPGDIADFCKEFTRAMLEYYPNMDARVYAYNLERVKFVYLDKDKIEEFSGSESSLAYFDHETQIIAIPNTLDLNTNEYRIVLQHEMGHMFSGAVVKWDLYTVRYQFTPPGVDLNFAEGLNCIFCYLPFREEYDFPLWRIGYTGISPYVYRLTQDTGYDISNMVGSNFYECCDFMDSVIESDETTAREVLSKLSDIRLYLNEVDVAKMSAKADDATKGDDSAKADGVMKGDDSAKFDEKLWDQISGPRREEMLRIYGYMLDGYLKSVGYSKLSQEGKKQAYENYLFYFESMDMEGGLMAATAAWDNMEKQK